MKKEIKMRVSPEQSAKVQEIVFANNGAWRAGYTIVQSIEKPYLFLSEANRLSFSESAYWFNSKEYEEVSADLFISTNGTCIQEEQPKIKLSEFLKQNNCYDEFIEETLKFQEATCPAEIINIKISSAFIWGDTKQGESFWESLDTKWGELPLKKVCDMDELIREVWLERYEENIDVEQVPTEVSLSDFTNEFPTLGLAFTQAIQEGAHEEFAKGGYISDEQQKDSVGIVHKEQIQGVDYDKLLPNSKPLVEFSKEYTRDIRLPKGESKKETPQPKKPKPCYMIFVSEGKAPKFVHTTLESAEVEAKRLSEKEIGREVFIMKKVKSFKSKIIVEEITKEETKGEK